jgi:predicted metal-dependent peptidase
MEAETQVKVVQAANLAKQAGQGTLDIDRLVDRIKEAQQDWKEELRRFIMQRSRDDYSWTRPDKRFVGRGIYLPSLRSERMGTLVVGVDMSGSCSDWFDDFYVQLKAIHEDLRPEKLVVIYCADRVARVEEFAGDDELDLHPYGAGGTDLRAIFRHVEEMDIEPACLVCLTDMETPFDDNAPDYPVLWAATTDHKEPWGERIQLRR